MSRQDTENLFRRFKGQMVTVKTISGGIYEGRISEISNDYVCIVKPQEEDPEVYVFFLALESLVMVEVPTIK